MSTLVFRTIFVAAMFALVWPAGMAGAASKQKRAKFPSFERVEAIVDAHFAPPTASTSAKAKPAPDVPTLITSSQVAALLDKLRDAGWNVADRDAILKLVLPDNHLLAQQLRTPNGQRFLQQTAKQPQVFDRLDRMTRMPEGAKTIRDMLAGPAGHHEMLAYMITDQGGQQLWQTTLDTADARQFLKPTGKLYTPEDLLGRLRKSHDAELAKRARDQAKSK